jgi:type IV pilus modification protein PilV
MARVTPGPRRNGERGFSLIELLVAAVIMAIGLLGLASLQLMSIRTAGTGTRMTDSVLLAERVVESASMEATQSYLAAKAGTTIPAGRLYVGGVQTQYYKVDLTPGNAGDVDNIYTVTVNVTNRVAAAQGGLDQVDVTVSFVDSVNGGTPNTRSVQVSRQVTHG